MPSCMICAKDKEKECKEVVIEWTETKRKWFDYCMLGNCSHGKEEIRNHSFYKAVAKANKNQLVETTTFFEHLSFNSLL